MTESELLREINADLPALDWKAGARTYLQQWRSNRQIGDYPLTKPFVEQQPSSTEHVLATALELFRNFANVLELLHLPAGARILDVACGGGWLAHYLAKMGYRTTGVDISEELLELARQRVGEDPHLQNKPAFLVADLEAEPLRCGEFNAAIFESCLHHFHNPIAALRSVAQSLAPEGVAVLIEGECRQGPLSAQWLAEMQRYHTIERPYTRTQMIRILELAGLPDYEFLASVDGWYSPTSSDAYTLGETIADKARLQNRCVAARTPEALQRILPWREAVRDVEFVEGFSAGSGGKHWCGPHGRLRIIRDIPVLLLEIGGQPTQSQTVALYQNGDRREVCLEPAGGSKQIELSHLGAGDDVHICSDFMFCPLWQGQPDSRVLSFWVERLR